MVRDRSRDVTTDDREQHAVEQVDDQEGRGRFGARPCGAQHELCGECCGQSHKHGHHEESSHDGEHASNDRRHSTPVPVG
jgi:hypothetical protein